MPEGHSVHRLARQFADVFAGEQLAVSSPQGRFADGAALLDGRVLQSVRAHGKQLFLRFEGELYLHVHLGLYGAWDFGGDKTFAGASSIGAPRRVGERELPGAVPATGAVPTTGGARDGGTGDVGARDGGTGDDGTGDDGAAAYAGPPAPVRAVRVRLASDHGWADLRGASVCAVATEPEVDAVLARLGPDPLDAHEDARAAGEEFARRILRRRTPVARLLMDQAVVAGIGNVYRAELLFRSRLDPALPGAEVGTERAFALWDDAVAAMRNGVRDGRIVTTDPELWPRGSHALPDPEHAHYVYKRHGRPCRVCGEDVRLADEAGRKLYWCPSCQA
ncbi:DNA-formamidopyrimidine glycosylase family protein [Sinomonas sp. ASV322]|uniref:Fpg/Nei family DNA glycosylase n=1 Tax=Sinomonas sp. ASV322 TaxID=3041920 RepID=UPI0027DC2C46|nr:DNA-formamidopyrimidine glycosylase family protein [Sinomonas sp. ASV322]MDQ4502325.1 DNA-formamidopyrimidine glycosylase family protein [Sinomonas sp. ASV322]